MDADVLSLMVQIFQLKVDKNLLKVEGQLENTEMWKWEEEGK